MSQSLALVPRRRSPPACLWALLLWAALTLAPGSAGAQPGHEGHDHGSPKPAMNASGTVQAFILIVSGAVLFGALRSVLVHQPWRSDASALPHAWPARRRARRRAVGLAVGIIAGLGAHGMYHPAEGGHPEDAAEHAGHDHSGERQFGDMGHRVLFTLAGAALGSLAGLLIPLGRRSGGAQLRGPGPETGTKA